MTTNTPSLQPPRSTLFVWDFDWTIINCNSDEYVPVQFLGEKRAEEGFYKLYEQHKDWHKCVESMVNLAMEEDNLTTDQVLEKAAQMPYLTGVRDALDSIHSQQGKTGQLIISDGNTLFIRAFLDSCGLTDHFDHGIITNKGSWEKVEGTDRQRLRVVHQSQQYGGHDCPRCPKNLCKTQALRMFLDENFPNESVSRIVYIGDGANDACPALNILKEGDVLLARAGKRRSFANERKGGETDREAGGCFKDHEDNDSSANNEIRGTFGILPALVKAKEEDPPIFPSCNVLKWTTGDDLKNLVQDLLKEF
jgi:2,3-diketo-5-methylthio-1-phosphopentane phosphatase